MWPSREMLTTNSTSAPCPKPQLCHKPTPCSAVCPEEDLLWNPNEHCPQFTINAEISVGLLALRSDLTLGSSREAVANVIHNSVHNGAAELEKVYSRAFAASKLIGGKEAFPTFVRKLEASQPLRDENWFIDASKQKQNTLNWVWGHYFWFGDEGTPNFWRVPTQTHMQRKWTLDLATFMTLFGFDQNLFRGATILDIGVWTGATSYLLSSLDAKHITSIEEVPKYLRVVNHVAKSFNLPIQTRNISLYDINWAIEEETYDVIYFPGVIYHLSDPFLALRLLYNRLRIGGVILVESMAVTGTAEIGYERITNVGNNFFSFSPKSLSEMMEDAGFTEVYASWSSDRVRVFAIGRRKRYDDFKRSGVSRRNIC